MSIASKLGGDLRTAKKLLLEELIGLEVNVCLERDRIAKLFDERRLAALNRALAMLESKEDIAADLMIEAADGVAG